MRVSKKEMERRMGVVREYSRDNKDARSEHVKMINAIIQKHHNNAIIEAYDYLMEALDIEKGVMNDVTE